MTSAGLLLQFTVAVVVVVVVVVARHPCALAFGASIESATDWQRPPVAATSCVRGAVTSRWLVRRPADDLGHRPMMIGRRLLAAG